MKNTVISKGITPKNKAIAVVNVVNHLIDQELFYTHKIAKPHQKYFTFDRQLEIIGWAVGKKKIKSIDIYLKENIVETAFLTAKRPGLNKKYQALAKLYQTEFGFRKIINLPDIKKTEELIIKACFEDNLHQEIGKVQFKPVDLEQNERPMHISPDFMVIGAMKSATSAIYNYLSQHSRVINREPKELHFFSKAKVYDRGWNWYLSQFAIKQNNNRDRDILVGDASPSYLADPDAPQKIKAAFPKIKIIVSLRNPVDRAISHYHHQVKRVDDEPRDIKDAFSAAEIAKSIEALELYGDNEIALRRHNCWQTTRYLSNGLYASQLKNWIEIFDSEQLLILDYHQLENEPDIFLNRLFSFLNIQDEVPSNVEKVYSNNYPDASLEVRARLSNYFQTHNRELREIPEINLSW